MDIKIGDKFNRWTVFSDKYYKTFPSGTKAYFVDCFCDCGVGPRPVRISILTSLNNPSISCGCYRLERLKEELTTHGKTGTGLYSSWQHMKTRCNDKSQKDYGERGISYTAEWDNFENFLLDMSEGYFEGAEIDRIDVNGNYEPSNCRWVFRGVNSHNKRKKELCTSSFIGVSWSKEREKWVASLWKDGKQLLNKRFNSEIDAATAYDDASELAYSDRPNKTKSGKYPTT